MTTFALPYVSYLLYDMYICREAELFKDLFQYILIYRLVTNLRIVQFTHRKGLAIRTLTVEKIICWGNLIGRRYGEKSDWRKFGVEI